MHFYCLAPLNMRGIRIDLGVITKCRIDYNFFLFIDTKLFLYRKNATGPKRLWDNLEPMGIISSEQLAPRFKATKYFYTVDASLPE